MTSRGLLWFSFVGAGLSSVSKWAIDPGRFAGGVVFSEGDVTEQQVVDSTDNQLSDGAGCDCNSEDLLDAITNQVLTRYYDALKALSYGILYRCMSSIRFLPL